LTPLILGLSGPSLTENERALLRDMQPAGYILFARNIQDPAQLITLTTSLRDLSGREDVPILIDQEGGRIQRMDPPHWPQHPPAATFGAVWQTAPMTAIEAARYHAIAIGQELRHIGISVDCLPLIDVPVAGAHDVIGDRAFGSEANMVASLGAAVLTGLREAGICGIIKHIPGHGRAEADSHEALPVVSARRDELEQDFEPFRKLAEAPMAMTAHVTYTAIDAARCASVSPVVVDAVIRQEIGFKGLLMCDDLGMQALSGSLAERLSATLNAGCDVGLHCSGDFSEMQELAEAAPEISPPACERLTAAMAWPVQSPEILAEAAVRRDELLAAVT
tara:strand:+ start:67438 stop:68442 length:1005 start_codon:yes stop_codon:yes gene_type:complete